MGGDGVSYGPHAPTGQTWKDIFLREVADRIDPARVHFMGTLSSAMYRRALKVSAAHVYLTYPFVLSWSLIEAMSTGCAVVASDTAPVRDVIADGENGLLVPFFAPERIADGVAEILRDPSRFRAMREAARRTAVETFDLQRVCLPRLMRLVTGQAPDAFIASPSLAPAFP